LFIGALLVAWSGAAQAQTWQSHTETHAITDAPVASATVNSGGPIYGWDFVAWCGETDDKGMRWQLYVRTKEVIDSYNSSTEVIFRFDSNEPQKMTASIGGDYSNTVMLLNNNFGSADELKTFVENLKSSSKLAVQIRGATRVFSLAGSTRALTRWVNHCKLG
jgi:hypothetical protein